MSLTRNTYTATPGQTDFDLTFPYISRLHVFARVNGTARTFTWVNNTRVRLDGPALAGGETVVILRETPVVTPRVTFAPNAVLTEQDLNAAQQQLLYSLQEKNELIEDADLESVQEVADEAAAAAAAATAAAGAAVAATANKLNRNLDNVTSPTSGARSAFLAALGFTTTGLGVAQAADQASARTALGLGNAATRTVGVTGGVASFDDPRFTSGGGGGGGEDYYIRPEDYGAEGDGVTNDATAVQQAIDAALAQSQTLLLANKYLVNSSLTISGNDLVIVGQNPKESTLILGSNASLVFVGGLPGDYTGYSFVIRDLKLRTTGSHPAAVVRMSYTANGLGRTQSQALFDNVDVSGLTAADHFGKGFHLTNVQNAAFVKTRVDGGDGGFVASPATWLSEQGIVIDGDDNPTEIKMWDTRVYNVNDAVTINGTTEGIYLNNILVISARRGIVDVTGGEPLLTINNSHINTYRVGIDAVNRFQSSITGCLIYAYGDENYTGIKLRSGVGPTLSWVIMGNKFLGFGAVGPKTAVDIDGVSAGQPGGNKHTVVEGNVVENFGVGVRLGTYASFVTVGPTNTYSNVSTRVIDNGPGNMVHYPLLRQSGVPTSLLIGTDDTVSDGFVGVNLSPDENLAKNLGQPGLRWDNVYGRAVNANEFQIANTSTRFLSGNGSPEGAVTAGPGSLYAQLDGANGYTLWVKRTAGVGNTGWVPNAGSHFTAVVQPLNGVLFPLNIGLTTNIGGTGVNLIKHQNDNGVLIGHPGAPYTATEGNLVPSFDATRDLGVLGLRWRNIYLLNAPLVSSDPRLKSGIAPITGGGVLDLVSPIRFRWSNPDHDDREFLGFNAAEVRDALELAGMGGTAVQEAADGILALATQELLPVLWAAVRELKAEVQELRARLT